MFGNPLLLADDGYQISRSVRLRSSASAFFNRTPGSTTNTTTWTWSGWVKRGQSAQSKLFGAATGTSNTWYFMFSDNVTDALTFGYFNGTNAVQVTTTPVYRDYSAWYHVVLAVDTTQATASNRVKIYVNGVQVTSFATATYPTLNQTTWVNNNTAPHYIGATSTNTSSLWDGYLTEINFIDGQALTPSSFGETDVLTGVWKPKKYTGTYGTNGFFLNFSDNSSNTATTIGKDYSGNGNNWTPNNISVTAGVTYDSMLDVPTLWADGGNGRGNYAVLNPLQSAIAPTAGNLDFSSGGGETCPKATIQLPLTGKWYWETYCSQTGTDNYIGVTTNQTGLSFSGTYRGYRKTGVKDTNGTTSAYGASWASGDTLAVAVDMDAGTIVFYKNGVSQGTAFSDLAGTAWTVFFYGYINAGHQINFGQRPFTYTPPTGFKALNTQNLPEPTIKKGNQFFDVSTWTGNGSARSITNSGSMQPDLVWVKSRTQAIAHRLIDAVRGAGNTLASNLTNAEFSDPQGVTSFNSNGFGVGTDTSYNQNGDTYVGWQWKEGATQGFDIVTYSGSSSVQNISHSLGVAPRMMIVKSRNTAGTDWAVYHASLGATRVINLDLTSAATTIAGPWNNTEPTSSVFTVGTGSGSGDTNLSGRTYVAYLFSEVAGFSRAFSYTGNGSADGPFIFLGFKPRWVMWKRTDAVSDWEIVDTARPDRNAVTGVLYANLSNAEVTSSGECDFTANGFKIRDNSNRLNASGGTYVGMAFAESPFKLSLAR